MFVRAALESFYRGSPALVRESFAAGEEGGPSSNFIAFAPSLPSPLFPYPLLRCTFCHKKEEREREATSSSPYRSFVRRIEREKSPSLPFPRKSGLGSLVEKKSLFPTRFYHYHIAPPPAQTSFEFSFFFSSFLLARHIFAQLIRYSLSQKKSHTPFFMYALNSLFL